MALLDSDVDVLRVFGCDDVDGGRSDRYGKHAPVASVTVA